MTAAIANALPAAVVVATWDVRLDCSCPGCHERIDLIQTKDFWDGRRLEPLQRDKTIEVVCPLCTHTFEATTDY